MFLVGLISLLLALPAPVSAGRADTLAILDGKVERYLDAIAEQPLRFKVEEADFLIGQCASGPVRDRVARKVYTYYMDSPVMGDEAVAIHLTDKWFSPGEVSFGSQLDLMNARLFADFNRRSLIGMAAPPLELTDLYGQTVDVLSQGKGRLRVLYFYDTECATCRAVSPALTRLLSSRSDPLEWIAVYTGDDADAWKRYRREKLALEDGPVRIRHYWDPLQNSDYALAYGVLQTPALFLLGPDGTILGRRLDPAALAVLLDEENASLDYGSEEARRLYEQLLPPGQTRLQDVVQLGGSLLERTEGQSRQRRQLIGDLLYYLSAQKGRACKDGAAWVADSLVLAEPDRWRADDSLKVLGLAAFVHEMTARAAVGTPVPDVTATGTLRGGCRDRQGTFRLRRLHRRAFVLFVTQGCEDCKAQQEAVDRRIALSRTQGLTKTQRKALKGVRYLVVNMDSLWSERPQEAEALLDAFDLTTLPLVLELDRRGLILDRYLSL